MQRQFKTAQQGQGWLVSFAALILVIAIGTVIYTISKSTINQPEAPAKELPAASFSDNNLGTIAEKLAENYLTAGDSGRKEDIQALANTLSNLKNSPQDAAKLTLQQLQDDKLPEALSTLRTLALDTNDKRAAAKIWVDIGNIENLKSEKEAIIAYQKSVTLDADNINAWNRIGHLERQRGQYDKAEIAYKNVTRLSNSKSRTQAVSLANFGLLYQSQDKYAQAIESFQLALGINTELKNPSGIASNSENLASLYRTQQDFEQAEQFYQKALGLYQSSGDIAKQIEIHSALGSLYQTKQQTELALAEYEQALTLNTENPSKRFSAGLYSNMGILAQQKNELDRAEKYFNQSLNLYQVAENPSGTADQYSNLAILARNRKQFEEGETLHLKAIALYEAVDNRQAVTSQHTNLGFLYTAWNKTSVACDYWQKSLSGLVGGQHQSRRDRIQAIVTRDCQVPKKETETTSTRPAVPVVDTPVNTESDLKTTTPIQQNPASKEAGQ